MIETKTCEVTNETLYQCLGCGSWEFDVNTEGQCMVCWNMEKNPDDFVLSEEEAKRMDECAAYIQKHNIQPNLDFPADDMYTYGD